MTKRLMAVGCACALALTTARARAQDNDPDDDEVIVVTATRTERSETEAPGSVTVIGRDEIESGSAADLQDVIDEATGTFVNTYGGAGASSTVRIRGTYGSQTLVLIDGRSATAPSLGEADLSATPPAFVERIEIVRGPGSALYGTGAVGGVVQLITREVPDELMNEVALCVGTFNTLGGSYVGGLPLGEGGIVYGVNALSTDGHRDNSDYSTLDVLLKYRLTAVNTGSLTLSFMAKESHIGIPGVWPTDGFPGAYGNEDVNSLVDYTDSTRGALQAVYEQENFKARIALDAWRDTAYQEYDDFSFPANHIAETSDLETVKPQLELTGAVVKSDSLSVTYGTSVVEDRFFRDVTTENLTAGTVTKDGHTVVRTTGAWWAQVETRHEPIDTVLGARWDEPSDYDGRFSYRANVAGKINSDLRVHAGIGTAFRAPSMNDLHWPSLGNPDLKPEDSREIELGVKWNPALAGGATINAAVFQKSVTDMIRWAPDSTGMWTPENVDDVSIAGGELTARAPLGAGFQAKLNYTYLTGTETGQQTTHVDYTSATPYTNVVVERDLAFTPRHQLALGVEWARPLLDGEVTVGISGTYTDEILNYYDTWIDLGGGMEYDVVQDTKVLDSYWVWGLRVALSWTGGEAFLKVDNALDEQYARQIGSSLTDRDFPMPGRTVTLGTKLTF